MSDASVLTCTSAASTSIGQTARTLRYLPNHTNSLPANLSALLNCRDGGREGWMRFPRLQYPTDHPTVV